MKNIYLIEWEDGWYLPRNDYIRAKSKYQALQKLKWKHLIFARPCRIISITKVVE